MLHGLADALPADCAYVGRPDSERSEGSSLPGAGASVLSKRLRRIDAQHAGLPLERVNRVRRCGTPDWDVGGQHRD